MNSSAIDFQSGNETAGVDGEGFNTGCALGGALRMFFTGSLSCKGRELVE